MFQRGKNISGNGDCLGHRVNGQGEYVWKNYGETIESAKNFGAGLFNYGLNLGKNTCVGIFCKNRPEVRRLFWLILKIGRN